MKYGGALLVIAPLAFGFRAPLPLPSSLRGPRAFSGKAAGPLQASNESPVWFGHAKPLLSLFLATSLVFHPNLDGSVLPFGVFNAPSAHAKVGSMGSNVAKVGPPAALQPPPGLSSVTYFRMVLPLSSRRPLKCPSTASPTPVTCRKWRQVRVPG